jgi:D-3-phosphoglycerate dehydrogenase / 2-oxoglutarate reductase
MNKKIFIATYPFGKCKKETIDILKETGWEIIFNPFGRRLKHNEVADMIVNVNAVIAGTEPYTKETIEKCKNLEVIARVGVGLDNVDFNACENNNIILTYTPEAPSDSVADFALAQIINLLRGIKQSDSLVREGKWQRPMGKLLKEVSVGVLGVGRIGKRVINRLLPFEPKIYACDIMPDYEFGKNKNLNWVSKKELFKICDIITIHIPMNKKNYHCVGFHELNNMGRDSFIINTSRGSIIDEEVLVSLLYKNHIGGAALDVYENEPYVGPLSLFDNVILTAHIASSTTMSRYLMELGASKDCIRVLKGEEPLNKVIRECLCE